MYNYHHATLHAQAELLVAAGLEHPQQIRPIHFSQRTSTTEILSFAKLYPSLRPGEWINGTSDPRFREAWAMARAATFAQRGRPDFPTSSFLRTQEPAPRFFVVTMAMTMTVIMPTGQVGITKKTWCATS